MKNMFESAETFTLYARIDACYFLMGKLQKELALPKDGLTKMIDNASGYTKARTKEMILQSIDLIEQIIECKKKIKAPFGRDKKMLSKLLKLQKNED